MPRRRTTISPQEPTDQSVQMRHLLAETQAISARLAALNEVATALQSSLDPNSVLHTLAREARWILDFQYCSLTEQFGSSYREIVLRHPDGILPLPRPLNPGGVIERVVQTGHAQLLHDLHNEPGIPATLRSAVVVPLRNRGEIIGALSFFADKPQHYRMDDLRIAAALAAQAGLIVQNTRLYQTIAEARDELHTILESISDGVVVVDRNGIVRLCNRVARQSIGFCTEATEQRNLFVALARTRRYGERLLRREDVRSLYEQSRHTQHGTLRLRDGRSFEWAYTDLRSIDSEPGYVVTLRDISDRVQLDELREDLIAMLVHDLRTPLSGVMMSIDLLDMLGDSADDRAEILARARRSSQVMLSQINTLLDLRRMEAGRLELQRDWNDLGGLLLHAASNVELQAQLSKIDFQVRIAPDIPPIMLDFQLINRVLENLLGNALKFTDSGKQVLLAADLLPGEGMVEIRVYDRGIGIPEEQREQIFAKFSQIKNEQSRRGFGLGLAFCRMAIEAHHGRIGVRENPGGGSIFWFRLPVEA